MKFRQRRPREEPEINFIPLIDVMLVILIFVMATTTYSKFAELKINLPTADAEKAAETPQTVQITVSANGQYSLNEQLLTFSSPEEFALELRKAAGNNPDPMIVINADGQASHQSVVNVMEAARLAGYGKLTFATQTNSK
ncbi:Biopolymer transport protein ExbD [Andreprevotia sp. IGB-42]|uniref:ExbD/TolR family protein n=1 Tax=Andreprevotia sp. IGB-42 TaxID=2497473 RepID=UPI0013575A32|nr:biopolymer transporter ExbD [Andreprevotia sp. IGB-42]KAF0811359.1 Biopolymer transport protein ExbD [Andreprevotia sp. IGB-42]